jgi:hypothetical protein
VLESRPRTATASTDRETRTTQAARRTESVRLRAQNGQSARIPVSRDSDSVRAKGTATLSLSLPWKRGKTIEDRINQVLLCSGEMGFRNAIFPVQMGT